jgi:hypothetical protein
MENIYIGVDPAFRKKGFCICIIECDTIDFITFEYFADFIIWLLHNKGNRLIFAVENSNLQNLSFDMSGNSKVISRKSRNVGTNQAVSQIAVDLIKRFDFPCTEYSPKAKGKKINDKEFIILAKKLGIVEINNYKGNITEQDKRDAFILCYKLIKKIV